MKMEFCIFIISGFLFLGFHILFLVFYFLMDEYGSVKRLINENFDVKFVVVIVAAVFRIYCC